MTASISKSNFTFKLIISSPIIRMYVSYHINFIDEDPAL